MLYTLYSIFYTLYSIYSILNPGVPGAILPTPAFGQATVGGLRPPKPPRLRRGFAPSKPGPRARPPGPGLLRRPTFW